MVNSFVFSPQENSWFRSEHSGPFSEFSQPNIEPISLQKKSEFYIKNETEPVKKLKLLSYNVLRPTSAPLSYIIPSKPRFEHILAETFSPFQDTESLHDVILFCEVTKEFQDMLLEDPIVREHYSI